MKTQNYNKTKYFITRIKEGIEFRVRELGPAGTPLTFTVKTKRRKVPGLMRSRLRALVRDAVQDLAEGRDREIILSALEANFTKVLSGKIFCRCYTGRIVKRAIGLTPDGRNNLYTPVLIDNTFEYRWVKA